MPSLLIDCDSLVVSRTLVAEDTCSQTLSTTRTDDARTSWASQSQGSRGLLVFGMESEKRKMGSFGARWEAQRCKFRLLLLLLLCLSCPLPKRRVCSACSLLCSTLAINLVRTKNDRPPTKQTTNAPDSISLSPKRILLLVCLYFVPSNCEFSSRQPFCSPPFICSQEIPGNKAKATRPFGAPLVKVSLGCGLPSKAISLQSKRGRMTQNELCTQMKRINHTFWAHLLVGCSQLFA